MTHTDHLIDDSAGGCSLLFDDIRALGSALSPFSAADSTGGADRLIAHASVRFRQVKAREKITLSQGRIRLRDDTSKAEKI